MRKFTFIKLLNRLGVGVTGSSNVTREDVSQDPARDGRLLLQSVSLSYHVTQYIIATSSQI